MEILDEYNKELQLVQTIQRDLDLTTAILLLTGQITIIGVFVTPGGFRVSLAGPLTGEERLQGKNNNIVGNGLIDAIDIILSILLIQDAIRVTGSFIAPGRFTINVSGPIFGVVKPEPTLPNITRDFHFFQSIVSTYFNVQP